MITLHESQGEAALEGPGLLLSLGDKSFLARRALKAKGEGVLGEPDLRSLTLAVRHGDAAAFSRFYDLYSFRVYRFLLVLTHGDENEAQEACQEVFIKVAKRLVVFGDEPTLWAWLSALTKNTFIDRCRARDRRDKRVVSIHELSVAPAAGDNSPGRLREMLADVLARLPAGDQELIEAAYVDERPLQELADGLGQSYKAVEARLGRLRQRIKEEVLRKLRDESGS